MAVLWVHCGYKDGLSRKIRRYTDEAETLQGRYSAARQMVRPYMDDRFVDTSSVYLKKRERAMQDARDKAADIEKRAQIYVDDVIEKDISMSKSIHKASYSYYAKKNIGPKKDTALSRMWHGVKTSASDFLRDAGQTTKRIVSDIKDFYEQHKYVVNIVKDIIKVIGAIALFTCASTTGFGLVILIGAVWATSKALYETATDCMALTAWTDGDIERAEELSNSTLTGVILNSGDWLDNKLGTGHLFKRLLQIGTFGLEVCEVVAAVSVVFKSVQKAFGLEKFKSLDIRNLTNRSFKQSVYYARNIPNKMMETFAKDPKAVLKGLSDGFKVLGKVGVELGERAAQIILS